jgi:hypothetical protein
MSGLYLLIPTLIVIGVSFLVVRAAAIALMMTGMEEQRARFQALSAFTGTGFTTRDAEIVVNNPRRRQIIMWLMILGNAGIVAVIVSATSSIVSSHDIEVPITIIVLIVGIFVLYRVLSRRGMTRRWEGFVKKKLLNWNLFIETNAEDLFIVSDGYGLMRVIATENSLLLDPSSLEDKLNNKTFTIIGINRGTKWISLPEADRVINKGDRVILYGRLINLHKIFKKEFGKN